MKFVVIDSSTHVVLSQTSEPRVVSILKSVLVDVSVLTLLPDRNAEAYNLITNQYISQNMFRYHNQTCEPAINIIEETIEKKKLARAKTMIAETLIVCADIKMNDRHHFYNPYMLNIISENNENIIKEYALIRNISVDAALKDLTLRKSSYDVQVIKIQGTIDKWVDTIVFENNLQKLLSMANTIIQEFFYR
jgi:hypothetical protein